MSLSVSHPEESTKKSPAKLQKIDETEEKAEIVAASPSNTGKPESNQGTTKEDDIVNEMVADFVDELISIDDTDDETSD